MRTLIALTLALASASTWADTCMVSPTQKDLVTGRFGKFREGGAANFGSGNAKPHMHDGLDFSTGAQPGQVVATADGVVTWAKARGTAGNTVMIRRPSGETAVFYHLSHIAVNEGDQVKAGQVIGTSGATGMGPTGVVHLHFIYGVPSADDARAKTFSADSAKNPTFNPGQLPTSLANKSAAFNYPTDPSPYFCSTYPIKPDGLEPVLGGDTKAQYAKLFGSTPAMGVPPSTQFDPTAIAAANGDALQAASKGASTLAGVLNDADGYGALPSAPLGDYESMSPGEMLATEAKRRFMDSQWNQNVTKVSSRALWVDYLKALGTSAYINEAIRQKKERVEALMAVYTSQKLAGKRAQVEAAQMRALRDDVTRAIK